MKDIFIVVPTLDPDTKIMSDFIKELQSEFKRILVVDDGSDSKYASFFNKLSKDNIIVLKHYKNLGKGRAIKTAFNYILNNEKNAVGCITCDSDGQHSVKDIKKCAEALMKNPDKLILGVRDFDKSDVPKRSRFGNKMTRNVLRTFIGLDISDTQTGLRGFSKELMVSFLDTKGERYEYETEMLLATRKKDIKIKEVVIDTIYIDNNTGSHFNPIKDSIRIYSLFSKYILESLSTYLLDILLFGLFLSIININSRILAATIIARIISTLYMYILNKNIKFKNVSRNNIIYYFTLVIAQMFISGCFVTYLFSLTNINVFVIKVIVDILIWLINIFIQREFVFVGGKNE